MSMTCCDKGGNTSIMRQLYGIDSMLTVARQFEAAQLRLDSLNPDRFNQAERAYYSLLLTQSHYKNYIDDTTDDVINVAVDYYKNHGDREKRTRSLLYQGCVYEVMGHPEKAIASYKEAENVAEDGDLENKAYAKLRLAVLVTDTAMCYRLQSEIAKMEKDWGKYVSYYEKANELADSILVGS